MKIKMICYGVRETEKIFFLEANKKFNYELILEKELLTEDNINTAKGCNAVMLRGNCVANQKNLDKLKEFGVEFLLTRTVGVNHIDLDYAHKLEFKMARVPSYSPNSVSELAVSLGLGLMRHTFYMAEKNRVHDFTVDDTMYAKEVRNSTIGIIGTGRIGAEVAKSFKGMGAKILGYDVYPNESNNSILEYTTLENLLEESDLISVHVPYIKGENDEFINSDFINKMKNNSFIVNCARGELVKTEDLILGVENGKIAGVALDVVSQETKTFFKNFNGQDLSYDVHDKLVKLYPKVVVTPHIGSYTDEAIRNMVEISYENLMNFIDGKECKNII